MHTSTNFEQNQSVASYDNFPRYLLSDTAIVDYSPFPLRFISKIEFRADNCWIWTGSTHSNLYYPKHKYGFFCPDPRVKPLRFTSAHRYAYQLCNGPILDGLEVDHICRVKLCVNPEHLRLLTHQQNCAYRLRSGVPKGCKWEVVDGKRRMVRS